MSAAGAKPRRSELTREQVNRLARRVVDLQDKLRARGKDLRALRQRFVVADATTAELEKQRDFYAGAEARQAEQSLRLTTERDAFRDAARRTEAERDSARDEAAVDRAVAETKFAELRRQSDRVVAANAELRRQLANAEQVAGVWRKSYETAEAERVALDAAFRALALRNAELERRAFALRIDKDVARRATQAALQAEAEARQ